MRVSVQPKSEPGQVIRAEESLSVVEECSCEAAAVDMVFGHS